MAIGFCLALVGGLFLTSDGELLTLQCQQANAGFIGQDSVINCTVKSTEPDVTIIALWWKKSGKSIFSFNKNVVDPEKSRFAFALPYWNTMSKDVSLVVRDTQMTDAGDYECQVVTDRGEGSKKMRLDVKAKYSKLTMSSTPDRNIEENMKVTIYCNAFGGFPAGRIEWFDQYNTNWTKSAETKAIQTEDKRFDLSSSFTVLQASSVSSTYRCLVFNSQGTKDDEMELLLDFVSGPESQKEEKSSVTTVAVIVIVGTLVCGLLAVALCKSRRTCDRHGRQEVSTYDDSSLEKV